MCYIYKDTQKSAYIQNVYWVYADYIRQLFYERTFSVPSIHAEGYPAAEMKHGPIALVDSEMPTVVIAPTDSLYDKIISNVRQVKARGGTVVAIITKGNDAMKDIADHCLEVPDVPECLTPLVVSVPLQLLAYYIAINKDRNVDQPRNLAKSVTVE